MKKGKCLVYLAVFNASTFIRETMDAILAQDYPNFEIVLTDDCSTDDSRNILRDYAQTYPDKIHYRENTVNLGIGRTLYTAYQAFHDADYFAGTGHDDLWQPNYLSSQIQQLERGDCTASFAHYRYTDMDGAPLQKAIFANELLDGLSQERLFLRLLEGNFLFAASGVVSLKAIGQERFGTFFGYDSDRLQDYEMWLNLSLYGKMCYNSQTTVTYRIREGGMGDGNYHILQEKYEQYSALRRVLFSDGFIRLLHRTENPFGLVNQVINVLEIKAKFSYLFGLLLMDFAQERLNYAEGTDLCQRALDRYYYESGLITKSLHGRTELVRKFRLACSKGSAARTALLVQKSGCFCLCDSLDDADIYVTTVAELSHAPLTYPIVCLVNSAQLDSFRQRYPAVLFLEEYCVSGQFQKSVLLWLEDHTSARRTAVSQRLIQQELENLRNSEIYRYGCMIYKIVERCGILWLIKKHRRKGIEKDD